MVNPLAQTVSHRYTGETVTFLETASQTNGAHLLIEVKLPPHGDGPPLHTHDVFTESFECVKGQLTLKYETNKNELHLQVGETFTAPIGVPHTFLNRSSEELIFRVKLTPPRHFEESMRIHYGLMIDGLTDKKGNPKSIAHTALILTLQNTRIVGIPVKLQRFFFDRLVRRNLKKGTYKSLEKYIGKPVESMQIFES